MKIAIAAIFALLAASLVAGQPRTTPLQPFTSVVVCAPFNLAIEPLTTPGYQIIVDADPGVAEAVNATVVNGVLTLGMAGGNAPNVLSFKAPNPIKVAVQ